VGLVKDPSKCSEDRMPVALCLGALGRPFGLPD